MRSTATVAADAALTAHMRRYPGQLLAVNTAAADEFSRLYTIWICARWDDGDTWVRSVWADRPTDGA